MKRKYYIIGGVVVILLTALLIIFGGKPKKAKQIEYVVRQGKFEILVNTTGELRAERSEDILAPSGLREIGIYNVKIADLIPEGTIVQEGDYVASLDRSETANKLMSVESDLQKIESQYQRTQLDTSLELRNARDELVNLRYSMEEKKIALDQSKFEPPAIIRQADIEYEKSKRAYDQAVKNYQLKLSKARAEMQEVSASLFKERLKRNNLRDVLDDFVIKAPKSGMVIYMKEWNGEKRKVGSTIGPWNPTVATLPDLSSMISKTYVNEIDIRRIKVNQEVRIGVDAFPNIQFRGVVFEVANIGEQLPNSDAKVFEVTIKVIDNDSILRPSMTTSNAIVTGIYDNEVYIPLEAIHNNDSVSYVYKTEGNKRVRQIVIAGESNENEIIIKKGLKKGDKVLLSIPDKAENLPYAGLELLPEIKKDKALKKKQAEERKEQQERLQDKQQEENKQGNGLNLGRELKVGKRGAN